MFFKANKRSLSGSRHGRLEWPISSSLSIFHLQILKAKEPLHIALSLFLLISSDSIIQYLFDKLWFCNDQLRLSAIPLKINLPCTEERERGGGM